MRYQQTIEALNDDAQQLEQLYQTARRAGEADAFKAAVDAGYAAAPDNLLYAAWFYRLNDSAAKAKSFAVAWAWVLPLALLNGVLFWLLSDAERYAVSAVNPLRSLPAFGGLPLLLLAAAPIAAALIVLYFSIVAGKRRLLGVLIMLVPAAALAYVLLIYPRLGAVPTQEQYLTLMILHLPLLAWACIGILLLAGRKDPAEHFAFLIKSLETFISGGLFVAAGGLFTAISFGLFAALGIELSESVMRLFIAGGGGLLPVLVTAIIYNPRVPPGEQAFDQGLGKLIALLLRIMLPLTLLLLLVYIFLIPFNFRRPFEDRDVLIIYNGMLFAVVALLIGATPLSVGELSPKLRRWLQLAIVGVALLTLLVGVYALAAIVYRTLNDRLTPNRLTFIGWNIVNIGLLVLLLLYQMQDKQWLHQLYRTFSRGMVAYALWTIAVIVLLPWLFGIDQGQIEALPRPVQQIIYEYPEPILLKCDSSPHVYLLEGGRRRWIKDIETFEAQGYLWRDVRILNCGILRDVPDGVPIPPDAGPPPQP